VDRVWDFDGMAAHPQERVFPNGHLELIVQLDDRYLDITTAGAVPTPAACVTGIFSRPAVVQAPRRPCRVLGVRLRPAGAWALLAHPLSQLAGLTADLGDLLGRAGDELAERCHDAGSGIDRVRRAVAWLGLQLRRPDARGVDPAARWVACRIADSGGTRPIAALRAEAGLTNARLIALFREQVGVTPKRLARIHRFDRALTLLTREGGTLASVAQRAGYFDQPHMNAEFREMAGLTPREFLAATRYPNSLSLPQPA
jgi:AraC-like DNA-binding protein